MLFSVLESPFQTLEIHIGQTTVGLWFRLFCARTVQRASRIQQRVVYYMTKTMFHVFDVREKIYVEQSSTSKYL